MPHDVCCYTEEKSTNGNLTGIRLFKSIVRKVRQKISENKSTTGSNTQQEISSATTTDEMMAKFERMSLDLSNSSSSHSSMSPPPSAVISPRNERPKSPPGKEAIRRLFSSIRTLSEDKLRSGYSSDSGTERSARDMRVRNRQTARSRSKSDSRRGEKKAKKILRPPPTYVYVRGLSGIPTQRIRVR